MVDAATKERCEQLLKDELAKDEVFTTAANILKESCKGNVYLMGGSVTRLLLHAMYGTPTGEHDYDFVIENRPEITKLPQGWTLGEVKHDNPPTLRYKNTHVDLFPLYTQKYLQENKLAPTIENFLKGVPFTPQSIAFDVRNQTLIGEVGIKAVLDRSCAVHNVEEFEKVVERKNMAARTYLMDKAQGWDLKPIAIA